MTMSELRAQVINLLQDAWELGYFVVEHQDGTVQRVQPDSLTFLGSKELFDQCDWSEE